MSSSRISPSPTRERSGTDEAGAGGPVGLVILGWLVPGAAHLFVGRPIKALVFFVVLTSMFAIGCAFEGRLFPFQTSEWLVFLAALAQWGIGLPRIVGGLVGWGEGSVTAITYEYGNTFLMASGLLNALVVLNAADLARARSRQ